MVWATGCMEEKSQNKTSDWRIDSNILRKTPRKELVPAQIQQQQVRNDDMVIMSRIETTSHELIRERKLDDKKTWKHTSLHYGYPPFIILQWGWEDG